MDNPLLIPLAGGLAILLLLALLLRLRGKDGEEDERVTGSDLTPGLAEALLATLDEA